MYASKSANKLTIAGLIVTMGIIYGDIGTSPLYVLKAVVGERAINEVLILGGISCIFWTLTLQTTLKYVIITLRADNKGEGGIFSLYALIRRRKPYMVVPAMIGGAALLADGVITPPISVSAAVEGLTILNTEIRIMPIVIGIITAIFMVQRFGSSIVGKAFGPIMLLWFLMLGVLGVSSMVSDWTVLRAINPYYAYELLVQTDGGFWLLGAVFLCTTGAEALYSDLGHCGRRNIRVSWTFVKTCLLLNYFGQGALLLQYQGQKITEIKLNPFYALMPDWFLIPGIIIATMAAIIASQALISGSFTLISEAVRMNVWPKVRIKFPSEMKGQLYVPSANWILYAGCLVVVMIFQESGRMEAAYGLAITLTMLMTTLMLVNYLKTRRVNHIVIWLVGMVFFSIEFSFLVANLVKFSHGGYFSIIISLVFISVMWIWFNGRKIKNRLTEFVNIDKYLPVLQQLSEDESMPKYATHLVYLTSADNLMDVETKIIYSILQKRPKRADIYWFVHIHVVDEPYTMEYKVDVLKPDDVIKIEFRLGFRVEQRVNLFFRKVVEELQANKEVDFTSRYASLSKMNVVGDFRFVVLKRHLSYENDLPVYEELIMDAYYWLDRLSLSEDKAFGLDTSSVTIEKVPLVITPPKTVPLKRVYN